MNPAAERILCLLIGYLCGNLVTGEIVTRACTGRPASELGTSGNPGMANVMASIGMKEGLIVLAGDIAKVIAATVLARYLFGKDLGNLSICWAGLGATLGHNFPFWMKFKGGKGVAVGLAITFVVGWQVTVCVLVVFILTAVLTKKISLASILASFSAIPAAYFVASDRRYFWTTLIAALIVIFRHKENISRLIKGEEKDFHFADNRKEGKE